MDYAGVLLCCRGAANLELSIAIGGMVVCFEERMLLIN
jgi:hypothetical protein